jgi:hypothetical protein
MAAVGQVRGNVVTDVAAWAAIPVAAALTAVLLWFPSAAVGIGLFHRLGQHTYLRGSAVAFPAQISLALLIVPALLLILAASRVGLIRTVVAASALVVAWQIGWAIVALVTASPDLIAWPLYAQPSEPEPWNPSLMFAVGMGAVAIAVAALATSIAVTVAYWRVRTVGQVALTGSCGAHERHSRGSLVPSARRTPLLKVGGRYVAGAGPR